MRRVVIQQFCEFHWVKNEQVEATAVWTMAMAEGQLTLGQSPKWIDVCDEHHEMLRKIYDVFDQAASNIDPAIEKNAPVKRGPKVDPDAELLPCQVCGLRLTTRGALTSHIYKHHAPDGSPKSLECPDCDFVAKGFQGLGAHRTHKHDYDSVAEALAAVPKNVTRLTG